MNTKSSFAIRPVEVFVIGTLFSLACVVMMFPLLLDPTAIVPQEHIMTARSMWAILTIVSLVVMYSGMMGMGKKAPKRQPARIRKF